MNLGVLDAPQRVVWAELDQVPAHFTLYGGTAIALRLGHRQSIDFDLCAFRAIDPRALRNDTPFLASAETLLQDVNTLTVLLDRGGPVKVSFFRLPRRRRVRLPQQVRARALVVASLLDLAATKVEVIQARAERKDYLDIDALLTHANLALPDMLGAASAAFGEQFNPQISLKALSHFADVSGGVPADVQARLAHAARSVDLDLLPTIAPLFEPSA